MNFDNYDLTSNGDGTYTLTPKAGPAPIDTAALVEEYRALRGKALALKDHRDQVIAKLQALGARRDELKALLQTDGVDGDTYDPEA